MKYYCYISNKKLDMLFPQIPRKFFDGLSGELSVNFGVIKASLKDSGLTATRISKLDVVSRYIQQTCDVGTAAEPKSYIMDTVEMRSVIAPEEGIVLFTRYDPPTGSGTECNSILLSGSANHVVGMESAQQLHANSITHVIVDQLARMSKKQTDLETQLVVPDRVANATQYTTDYLKAILKWSHWSKGPLQRYEFLAKTLVNDALGDDRIVLATPIYVAMAE
jgi:hypothetical protein